MSVKLDLTVFYLILILLAAILWIERDRLRRKGNNKN